MNATFRFAALPALLLSVAACSSASSGIPSQTGQSAGETQRLLQWATTLPAHRACPGVRSREVMQCDVLVDDARSHPDTPGGWGPPNFVAAYHLPSGSQESGTVVALVDAYDNPDVATDLAAYRTEFNLGTANFTKYNQKGEQGNYPENNASWGVEIDLDVQMVSAVCPSCKIILIEANTNKTNDLFAAEKEAVKLGATIVSNSWGGGTGGGTGGAFNKSGVLYLASAGDSGYGMQNPADFDTVVSVGGTILKQDDSGAYSEIVWPDSGGGCSTVSKPAWQKDPDCQGRTGNDISAVAFWASVYDTDGETGWLTVRGTSVASPLMAGMFALAGNSAKEHGGKNIWLLKAKEHANDFHTGIPGTLANCPSNYTSTYICTSGLTGSAAYETYSGATGWGTPNGLGGL
jgi:subtilase family serine protease